MTNGWLIILIRVDRGGLLTEAVHAAVKDDRPSCAVLVGSGVATNDLEILGGVQIVLTRLQVDSEALHLVWSSCRINFLCLERVRRLGQVGLLVSEVRLDLRDGPCVCRPVHQLVLLLTVKAVLTARNDAKVVLGGIKIGFHLFLLASLELGIRAANLLERVDVGVANLSLALLVVLAHFVSKLPVLILERFDALSFQNILDRVNQRLALAVALRLDIVFTWFS